MGSFQMAFAGFYAWWIFLNGAVYFAEFHFIQSFTGIQKKWYMFVYILLNSVLTFLVIYFQSPGMYRFILHIGILACFFRFFMHLKWTDLLAPVTIIFTLSTFSEGFQAVFMKCIVHRNMAYFMGILAQMAVSGVLTIFLVTSLYLISKKYICFCRVKSISSYLYVLILPSVFIVWIIRGGLGLDTRLYAAEIPFFGGRSASWALVWMAGACAIFFIILQVFHKIITLTMQENEKIMLADQVREQKIYIQEAKKRNEQYRAFQHDIDNHFLVLSGLLHEKKYTEAEHYSDKLRSISETMLIYINTGNPVADILLKEKINFARANGIRIDSNVHFSTDFFIEDMDLCILLANALDNAIHACMDVKKTTPEISVMAGMKHHFLIIEVINTMEAANTLAMGRMMDAGNCVPEYGTGLKNIKQTVKKYDGMMEVETGQGQFRLSMLLCLGSVEK